MALPFCSFALGTHPIFVFVGLLEDFLRPRGRFLVFLGLFRGGFRAPPANHFSEMQEIPLFRCVLYFSLRLFFSFFPFVQFGPLDRSLLTRLQVHGTSLFAWVLVPSPLFDPTSFDDAFSFPQTFFADSALCQHSFVSPTPLSF